MAKVTEMPTKKSPFLDITSPKIPIMYRASCFYAYSSKLKKRKYWPTSHLVDVLYSKHPFMSPFDTIMYAIETEKSNIEKIFQDYVELVSGIQIVKQVLLVEEEDKFSIWTIIKAEPFDDSLREPIYQSQLDILRQTENDIPIDFQITNISEYADTEHIVPDHIIPAKAKLSWHR